MIRALSHREALGSILVYVGLIISLSGAVCTALFATCQAVNRGLDGVLFLGVGLILVMFGFVMPAIDTKIAVPKSRLDEFAPLFQFREAHSTRVRAPRARVYRAIKEGTADEITFFRLLTWLRRFGRRGPDSIMNPPERVPVIEIATRTSFLLLAEEVDSEILVGTLVKRPSGAQRGGALTPMQFGAICAPGYAKATMNFLMWDEGHETTVLTTETRVHATDASTRRRFAAYWRVIYPGSAVIRRMWLRAVKRRAEAPQ